MKRLALWNTIAAVGMLVATAAAASEADELLTVSPSARSALGIAVEAAQSSTAFSGAEASATVVAPPGKLQTAVSPFDGVVVETLAVPGLSVAAGDGVAVIYSQAYVDADAELDSRRLMVNHRAELAAQSRRLLDAGLISQTEADEAEHEAGAAALAYDAMSRRMAITRPVEKSPGRFILVAPASGVVAHVYAESGDTVAAEGAVATIFEGGSYWARALAPARSGDVLETGAQVAVAGWATPGAIVAIDPEVDEVSRSLEILVSLPDDGPWRLGQIVDLSFQAEAPADSVSVPAASVVRVGGRDVVFVERADGFEVVAVDVLARSRESVLIGGGLSAGDRVATAGLAALKNMAEAG